MELQISTNNELQLEPVKTTSIIEKDIIMPQYLQNPFIEANTKSVSLFHLQKDCIIPVFSKDNERTISHQEFVEVVGNSVEKIFPNYSVDLPEIRISHQIKGRVPSAIYKDTKDLLDFEKTTYYERMAFIIRVPGITENINGNEVALTVGGVRAYNKENLYSKKSAEKFQVFLGFQNMVCCNLCISTDGMASEIRVNSILELAGKVEELLKSYNLEKHLKEMEALTKYSLTEKQFAQVVGRARLYNYLPKNEKLQIPEFY